MWGMVGGRLPFFTPHMSISVLFEFFQLTQIIFKLFEETII